MASPIRIDLPRNLTLDTLPDLVRSWPSASLSILVRLHAEQWVHPAGIVGLACLIEGSRRKGTMVEVAFDGCPRVGYWERMGFFRVLNLPAPPVTGEPRPPAGRFSELRRVADIHDVDAITEELVDVTDPNDEARKVYRHVVSEALNNVCQHSEAEGFCLAQFYPQQECVRFCIADFGCGLRHALRAFGPEDDMAAVAKALEVGVTGRQVRMGQPGMRNRGVGLSSINRLVVENEGEMMLWSGIGVYSTTALSARGTMPSWQGTLLAATMTRNKSLRGFGDIMRELTAELRERERGRPPRRGRLP